MMWRFEFNSYALTTLIPLLFLSFLTVHGYRNRTVPGAVPFILQMVLSFFWILSNALRLSVVGDAARIFLFKFETAMMLPLGTAAVCFVVEYAGLGHWLNSRIKRLLTAVPLVLAVLIVTNDTHHLVWKEIGNNGIAHADIGMALWGGFVYGNILGLVQLAVLVWLFLRSPRHRWIAAGLVLVLVMIRTASFFSMTDNNSFHLLNPIALALNVALVPYAFVFYGFRVFDVVPVARNMVIDRMMEAMVVLDSEQTIADCNVSTEKIFGLPRAKLVGRGVASALAAFPDLLEIIRDPNTRLPEISLGNPDARWFHVAVSPLIDRYGFVLGQLIWMRDTTEQRQIQKQMLDRQLTQAMLQERELLARELHDGVGQILAAAQMQIYAARHLLAKGESAQAAKSLQVLSGIVQEAKESVRTYLAGVNVLSSAEKSFLDVLKKYLVHYGQNYEIRTELNIPPDMQNKHVDAAVAAQLQPILQEALTNVRRHAKASLARVGLFDNDGHLHLTIEDDGQGFDTQSAFGQAAFGLRSMRGRAESAGGRFEVNSTPGKGTCVRVQMPWRKEMHESPAGG